MDGISIIWNHGGFRLIIKVPSSLSNTG